MRVCNCCFYLCQSIIPICCLCTSELHCNSTRPTTTEIFQRTQILNPVHFLKSLSPTWKLGRIKKKKINHQPAIHFNRFKSILNAHHSGHGVGSQKSQSWAPLLCNIPSVKVNNRRDLPVTFHVFILATCVNAQELSHLKHWLTHRESCCILGKSLKWMSQSVIIQPVFFTSMRANVSTTLGHPFIQNSLCKRKWLILNAYTQTTSAFLQVSAWGQKLGSLRVRERKSGDYCEPGWSRGKASLRICIAPFPKVKI